MSGILKYDKWLLRNRNCNRVLGDYNEVCVYHGVRYW